MSNPTEKKPTRSRVLFKKASPEAQELIKNALSYERQVRHMKNRVVKATGLGIHETLLQEVKRIAS